MRKFFNRLRLTQQWIGATLLALLPLTVAVLYGGWSLATQTNTQRQLISRLQHISQTQAALVEKVNDLERSARQYSLLQNPKFLSLVQQDVSQITLLVTQLHQQVDTSPTRDTAQLLLATAQQIETELIEHTTADESAPFQQHIQTLKTLRDDLVELVKLYSQQLLNDSDATFNSALTHLLIIGILAIPGTILLVILSSAAVSRPIWRLASAIQDLGHARWQTPIQIKGPADLQALGENLEWMRLRLVIMIDKNRHFYSI